MEQERKTRTIQILGVWAVLAAAVLAGCNGGGVAIPDIGDWGTATLIETGPGEAVRPRIAMDGSGNGIAVWTQLSGNAWNIYANRFARGMGWGLVTLIENGAGEASSPRVATDVNGNAVAVWQQWDGAAWNIYANRYVPGTGWGAATLIEFGEGDAFDPQVGVDGKGNAIAVWTQRDGAAWNVFANRYLPGTGWGTGSPVKTVDGDAWDVRVAVDELGGAVAVWQQWDGTTWSVYANRFVPGTGWGTESVIENGMGDVDLVDVAVDGLGNAIAVWKQGGGIAWSVYANRFVPGTGWGTESIIGIGAGKDSGPHVAMDVNGNAVVVWKHVTGTVHANRYIPGKGWEPEVLLGTVSESSGNAQVAFDRLGNAVAVWERWDGTSSSVYANWYMPATGWGISRPISTGDGYAMTPMVATDGFGNAIAVWWEYDGLTRNVCANRYETP